jgi:hypothetical protein
VRAVEKVELKKALGQLYNPSSREVAVVDVPQMNFLMIDGEGDPNTSEAYKEAVGALYATSYALKFMVRKGGVANYSVMPLEGLWWVRDWAKFNIEDKDAFLWTMMIMQPEWVTPELFERARSEVGKKGTGALDKIRLAAFHEGQAAQIMHVGPYSTEGHTVERLHGFIAARGGRPAGKHHEIYLGDPRRTAPDRLKTIIRQPFE